VASTRIGRHAAESLANQGFVVLAGVRKKEDAQSIVDMKIETLAPVYLDVTDERACVAVMKQVKEMTAKTSLPMVALVNNAGLFFH
jgi:NAD(P)-dependent dehydrogenase (short-subunit alcohol dehydrogenase family)